MNARNYPFALPPGTDISGYVIERVIGAGGFGITYKATNPVTGVTVAIKEFFPQGLASRENATVILHSDVSSGSYETALKKFEQEAAKLTGRFRHRNIVRGLNFLRMNNTAYFVMDFVEGLSFDQWLIHRSAPPNEAVLRVIFERVLNAVQYIHDQNAMHRDLTPKNIMIRTDGEPILVDFGASGEGLDTERFDSTAFAQPNYAPPEQLVSDDATLQGRHTDIFSLAGVLFRAISGRPPVKPLKRSHDVSISGRDADPYVPAAKAARDARLYRPDFLNGIDQGLRLDYRKRPATIRDFRAALGWVEPFNAVPTIADDATPEPNAGQIAASTEAPIAASKLPGIEIRKDAEGPVDSIKPKPRRALVFGLAGLGAVSILGLVFFLPASKPEAPPIGPTVMTPARVSTADAPKPNGAQAATGMSTPIQPPEKPPLPREPDWQEYASVVAVGRELATTTADRSAESCRKACRDDELCQAVTMSNGRCRLLVTVTGVSPEPGARTFAKPNMPALAILKSAVDLEAKRRGLFKPADGIALAGGQSSPRAVANQAQCSFACLSDGQCKGWIFTPANNGCRLYRDVTADQAGLATGLVGGVEDPSGLLIAAINHSVTAKARTAQAFPGVELAGEVVGTDKSASAQACRQSCLGDAQCIASVQAEGACTRLSRVDSFKMRGGAEAYVDVRQTSVIAKIDLTLKLSERGQPEAIAGFELIGDVIETDRAREATTPEACQVACAGDQSCAAFSFAATERRCRLLSIASEAVPDSGQVSGLFMSGLQNPAELVRKRIEGAEQSRANFHDLAGDCAPQGPSTPAALGSAANAEQCAFLCRSGETCLGWSYSQPDKSCQLLSSVTGANAASGVVAGIADPTGKRSADLSRMCGMPVTVDASANNIAPSECDRLAGYAFDLDLPKGTAAKLYEHIDPTRAVPACAALVGTSPTVARWKLGLARALERDGREAEARAAYLEASEAGSAAAAFLYGIMADKGQGGPEDDLEAERAYTLARDRGVLPAATALALLYTTSERVTTTNDQDIIALLTEAANRGHSVAMYRLGEAYEKGRLNRRLLPFDPREAQTWFAKSYAAFSRDSEQRDANALRFLSLHYDAGRGAPRNTEQAVRYLQRYLSIVYGQDNVVARRRGSINEIGFEEWSLDTRKAFQAFLRQNGGLTDEVDGVIGIRSREAIERWLGIRS